MSNIKKMLAKAKKVNMEYIAKTRYITYYKKLNIKDNYILLDSQQGKNINGNIYYVLKELNDNPNYKDYKLFLPVFKSKYEQISNFLKEKGITRVNIVKRGTLKYYKLMATCKYLINDTSFLSFFMKKEGQIYLNVWHGTPLKFLGRSMNTGFESIGNVQKNFIVADYLLYPNEYMMKHMVKDYMLENICNAKALLAGYPRNTIFFDEENKKKIRQDLNIDDLQVIVYMPTYRNGMSAKKETELVNEILIKIDKKLKDNQIMYVNLHPFVGNGINYDFKHIKKFPSNYETYEFLAASDVLVTDYSSVFYDYAVTNNKIILFNYDEKEYFKERGCYVSLDELPFPKTPSIPKLIAEINNPEKPDYKEFLNTYCKYDCVDLTKKLCEKVILNKDNDIKEIPIKRNNKKNILIYPGSLAKNGLTSSLVNLINVIDKDKYNIYVTYMTKVAKPYANVIRNFPEYINYIPTDGSANATLWEKFWLYAYLSGMISSKFILKKVLKIYKYDIKRMYGDIKFDTVVQFGGYDSKKILTFSQFDCNKVIYVHSNMLEEIKTRNNQNINILNYAYNTYDKVAVVTESLIPSTEKLVEDKDRIRVVHNLIDYKNIMKKSDEDIVFDKDTVSSIPLDELKKILKNKKAIKFVNVGRFSPEKGHERLIRAFSKIYSKNKNCYLIIIGGHGKSYRETLKLVNSLRCKKNIIIIKSLTNPFPIVKKCNCFALSSFYEGFGLALAEADILGLKTFSVDIEGPKKYLLENNGNIVENSEKGIYDGMKKYLNNELKDMNVDYEKYNKNALKEFYDLIEK